MATALLVLVAAVAVLLAVKVKSINIVFDDEDPPDNETPQSAGKSATQLGGKGRKRLKS